MATRRRFLSFLGVGAAAGPLAAKAAVEQASLGLVRQGASLAQGAEQGCGGLPAGGGLPYEKILDAAAAYHKTTGRHPDYIDRTLREQARHISFLDPDLVSKRAWSFNVKIVAQRQRNYERLTAGMARSVDHHIRRSLFEKTTGWYWPF